MRFLILAFNPNYVNEKDIEIFIDNLRGDFPDLKVHFIPHIQKEQEPIYCVQFADTKGG